ncbi:MAG: TetR/AcrR family transcriptional regulator [Phycisphaeraceae bacterium]|jgi:AcrR family transcriptional regulator
MARPNRSHEKRAELMPIVAQAFSELGYRKATTAELAARCNVQENILYRLWNDKKAMFAASIDYLYDATMQQWQVLIEQAEADPDGPTAAERILAYDAEHRGEKGFYKITFAALSETDDPDVLEALKSMYRRFTEFIEQQVGEHRTTHDDSGMPETWAVTWAILGLATAADIGRETGLLDAAKRKAMIAEVGRLLLEGRAK